MLQLSSDRQSPRRDSQEELPRVSLQTAEDLRKSPRYRTFRMAQTGSSPDPRPTPEAPTRLGHALRPQALSPLEDERGIRPAHQAARGRKEDASRSPTTADRFRT